MTVGGLCPHIDLLDPHKWFDTGTNTELQEQQVDLSPTAALPAEDEERRPKGCTAAGTECVGVAWPLALPSRTWFAVLATGDPVGPGLPCSGSATTPQLSEPRGMDKVALQLLMLLFQPVQLRGLSAWRYQGVASNAVMQQYVLYRAFVGNRVDAL